jgi:hypothetical protein
MFRERLPLGDVLDKSEVVFGGSSSSSSSSRNVLQRFSCCFRYHHVNMTLCALHAVRQQQMQALLRD